MARAEPLNKEGIPHITKLESEARDGGLDGPKKLLLVLPLTVVWQVERSKI